MLNSYLQQTQRLLGDQREERFNIADLTEWVNFARGHVASKSQCIRLLPPTSGSFATLTVPAGGGGSGYTSAPTVTITAPDAYGVGFTQATGNATIAGGAVTGYNIINAGTGYVNPEITISGGGGSGAKAAFTLTPFMATVPNQEVYPLAAADAFIPSGVGIRSILSIQSIAVSWGSNKPILRQIDWSGFQAYCRSINLASTNWPTVWAQYAQGAAGSVYLFPIPSQVAQMEWDCYCQPIDLVDDDTVEAIPYPFTRAVPYYAAYQAYMSDQKRDFADYYEAKYLAELRAARADVSPAVVADFYMGL
jgi:hypothetical protein